MTVGISFLNAERYLREAIHSVSAQTIRNWRLILIDDGSEDASLEIAKSFTKDARILLLSDGLNLGHAARLNQISELATTPFIARMDADDLMSTRRLEIQIGYLINHPSVDLTATGVISMSDDCEYKGQRFTPWSVASTYSILTHKTGIVHASILGRKEWFVRNPYRMGFDRADDIELWVRTNEKQDLKISFISNNLYFYREFDSTSPRKVRTAVRSMRKIASQYPMRFWGRLIVRGRLVAVQILAILSVSGFVRILAQRKRNTDHYSKEDRKIFELELAKINTLDLS
ncbi:glycosyltransferase family 2 protein [Actinomycetota bacterium]|nr:glycosyltransferase family 2 protein [Actinomycetota bacterium]